MPAVSMQLQAALGVKVYVHVFSIQARKIRYKIETDQDGYRDNERHLD